MAEHEPLSTACTVLADHLTTIAKISTGALAAAAQMFCGVAGALFNINKCYLWDIKCEQVQAWKW